MSYEKFFHLKDAPFRLTPDPDYFFPSGVHKQALDTMVFSINAGEGFVLITGTPGAGKTLLVRTLLRQLGDKVSLALVLNPTLSPRELLWVILDDLGVFDMDETEKLPKEKLLRLFREHLMENAARGIKTLIIIDEAQNLPKETLEELRMLSNLESDKEKLLQIILVGQLELEETLQYDDMKQLAQRITIRYRLQPLSAEETGAYVRHRLEVAGGSMNVKFMPRVMSRIYSLSNGIPRRINLICERALMAAYVDEEKSVSRKHLIRAIKSIEGNDDRISTVPVWLWPALGGSLLVLAALWFAIAYKPGVAVKKEMSQAAPVSQIEKSVPKVVQEPAQSAQNHVSASDPAISNSKLKIENSQLTVAPVPQTADLVSQTVAPVPQTVAPVQQATNLAPQTAPVYEAPTADTDLKSAPKSADQVPQTAISAPLASDVEQVVSNSKLKTQNSKLSTPAPSSAEAPGLLPENEFYLAVDRDKNIARLWQGTPSGPVVKHEFELDWRIMEGLYVLGNDKQKGAFIFNPILFQWGGYNLLNAAALWSQVDGHVTDTLVPVIVYSSDKLDKERSAGDISTITDSIDSWSQAWRDRDIRALMGFYGKSFNSYSIDNEKPETYTLSQLSEIRGRILGTSSYISLNTSTPVIMIDPQNPDLAIAFFRQEYKSNIYKDKGTKVLYLRREGNYPEHPWKIVAKFFLEKEA